MSFAMKEDLRFKLTDKRETKKLELTFIHQRCAHPYLTEMEYKSVNNFRCFIKKKRVSENVFETKIFFRYQYNV